MDSNQLHINLLRISKRSVENTWKEFSCESKNTNQKKSDIQMQF